MIKELAGCSTSHFLVGTVFCSDDENILGEGTLAS